MTVHSKSTASKMQIDETPKFNSYTEGTIWELEQTLFATNPKSEEIYKAIETLKRLQKEKDNG